MSTIELLKSTLGALPFGERAELAAYLFDTLESVPESELTDEQWQAEIARRNAEIRAGTAIGRPIEEFMEELRKQYP